MNPFDATEFIGRLPWVAQVIFFAVVGFGAAAYAARAYFEKLKSPPPKEPAEMVLTAGTIADMQPVREACEQLKRIADGQAALMAIAERNTVAMEQIAEIMNEEEEQAEFERKYQERARAERDRPDDPPRPPRRRRSTMLTL